MGTPQMPANVSTPYITINGVTVPVLNEPVANPIFDQYMNMYAHESKVIKSAITTFETLDN